MSSIAITHSSSNHSTKRQVVVDTHHSKWYSPETGIFSSKHSPRPLPTDPFLDVVSFIFSHHHSSLIALIDSSAGSSISYSDLFTRVKSMASGLHRFGIKQGDVVLILLPNSISFPVVFLGALFLGAVVTTMNPLCTPHEIKKQAIHTNARVVFTAADKIPQLGLLGIPIISVPEDVNVGRKDVKFETFYNLVHGNSGLDWRELVIRQQDTAVILYSSGTTGASKGVVLTHKNLISMIELFVKFESLQYEYPSSENVYLAAVPMFHIYGLSIFVLGLFCLGSKVVVMKKFDADEMVAAIDKYRVTHFPVVPPILTALVNTKDVNFGGKNCSFRSLKQVSSGAAPLSNKTIEQFLEILPHVDLIQGYGMTESTAVSTRGFNTKNVRKYSSIGLLAPNTEAKLVDWITGCFLPPGGTGELWIRGPGVMQGYLNDREATAVAIDKEGWLRTGDIVHIDSDGFLFLADRLKDIIKYKGFQIAPADLEAILISHPHIIDAAVTSAADKEGGEIPVAFVVKKGGSSMTEADVVGFVAGQVAPYKKVRKVIFTQSLPKSASGKILRRELKKSMQVELTSKLDITSIRKFIYIIRFFYKL